MRVQLLLLAMLSMQSSLLGMDIKATILSEDNHNIAREIVITNCLANDDYDTYRTVAMLSKIHNKIVEDKYRPIKKRIENFIKWKSCDVTGYKTWNRDFSKCAWVTITDSDSDKKNLKLTLVGLVDKNRVMSNSQLWQDFYFPIFEDDVRPFFDKDGRACFYGFGDTPDTTYGKNPAVVEYSLGCDNKAERHLCRYSIKKTKDERVNSCFNDILDFPILLKALLQSTQVDKISPPNVCSRIFQDVDPCKTYDICGVIFPENYKIFKKHIGWQNCHRFEYYKKHLPYTYDTLHEIYKNAFDKQYEKQQKEKSNGK